MYIKRSLIVGCVLCAIIFNISNIWASENQESNKTTYQVTITNLTYGQPIAPLLAATHRSGISFFKAGETPLPELAPLAEAGNGNPMAALLLTKPGYGDARVGTNGTSPGKTTTMTVTAPPGIHHVSFGAMLGNTNDGFIAVRDVELPKGKQTVTYYADGYDAGTETNNELCSTVPGPACGGVALSPEDTGEGFVHIHRGIHGIGELDPAIHDWRNPVAQITIKRMN